MTIRNLLISVLLCGLPALCGSGCARKEYNNAEGMVWHTVYHVTYESERDLTDSIIAVFDRVGDTFNVFRPESLASRVNASDSVEVNADFIRVWSESVRVNSLTHGAFDPTLGPLITAWGFGKGHTPTADTLRIDSLLRLTGIARTRIENGRMVKGDRRMEFNFSAIAKGFGCDMVGEMLSRNGSDNWLVEIGGEICCKGESPSGRGWRVSVDRPVLSDSISHESQCVIEIRDMSVATSGDYRNFHTAGTERFGHTISTGTGRPARTDVLSATVVARTCMEADALATSMMALGSTEAKQLAAGLKLPVMLVLADWSVWQTPEFEALIPAM